MKNQTKQTKNSFTQKWLNNPDLIFNETSDENSDVFNWIIRRNGWHTPDDLRFYLLDKARLLDAGCGNGRVTKILHNYAPSSTEIIGVDGASYEIADNNLIVIRKN